MAIFKSSKRKQVVSFLNTNVCKFVILMFEMFTVVKIQNMIHLFGELMKLVVIKNTIAARSF